jgi:glycosyltransferase involved in cell wall biosynthesis
MNKISIITPVLNEEDNILDCYNEVKNLFAKKLNNYDYEHIFVDNMSEDSSVKIMTDLCKNDKKVKLIINNQNYGILPSIYNTLKFCESDYTLVCYAADLQDPIEFIFEAIKKIESENVEIVYAVRNLREENFFYKYIKKIYYFVAKLVTNNKLKPNVNVFQLITNNVRLEILQTDTNDPFIPYLLQSNSFKKIGIETKWKKRKKNKAKNNFFTLFAEAKNAIFNYSGIGSTLSFSISIVLFLSSFLLLLFNVFFLVMNKLNVYKIEVLSGIPTIIIFNLIAFSAIFLILGTIAENINHLLQIKIGKKVRIRKRVNFE